MEASGHRGETVCCCGSVRLFGHETAVNVCVCEQVAGFGVFMSVIGTKPHKPGKRLKRNARGGTMELTASSLSSCFSVIIYLMCFFVWGLVPGR